MKPNVQYNTDNSGNGMGCQSNLSFFQVADCISEEAEQSVDDDTANE
jgi:hypothetical protein